MSNNESNPAPTASTVAPGMPCTFVMYSDRKAGTVESVTLFKSGARKGLVREVIMRRDRAIRIDGNGMSDAQNYRYEPDPEGALYRFTVRAKEGMLANDGGVLLVGVRSEYFDYSF